MRLQRQNLWRCGFSCTVCHLRGWGTGVSCWVWKVWEEETHTHTHIYIYYIYIKLPKTPSSVFIQSFVGGLLKVYIMFENQRAH